MDEPARRRVLRDLLGECDPHVGFAIALYYLEGFTYQEMAEICGEEPATLQARVARAIPKLQKRVKSMRLERRAL
jgi:DNA-directed RNA polymerase specialized sigma24 family protein